MKLTDRRSALSRPWSLCLAPPAGAGRRAPQPAKPVATNLYSGRWYEIARTPNKMQADCQGSTTDFSGWRRRRLHGGADLPPRLRRPARPRPSRARATSLPASGNAKMQLGYPRRPDQPGVLDPRPRRRQQLG